MNISNSRTISASTSSSTMSSQPQQIIRNKPPPGGKLMRLRCRFRTLHESYLINGKINEKDADVTFVTMDGQKILGHKIILCSASTLFSTIFADQYCGEMTTVVVPDVRGETMRLILHLAYSESVNLTTKQINEVGSFISLFGMEWKQFNFNEFDDTAIYVNALGVTKSEPSTRQVKHSYARQGSPISNQSFNNNQEYLNVASQLLPPEGKNLDLVDSEDYIFKVQGYENVMSGNKTDKNSSRLKQQLTSLVAKPLLKYGKPASKSYEFGKEMARNSSRPQNSNHMPRVETRTIGSENNDTDFGSVNSNSEDAQKLIKEWVAKVGKDEDSNSPKRLRLALSVSKKTTAPPRSPTPPLAANQAINTCTVCSMQFVDHEVWKWHEKRHIGMGIFHCGQCNLLFGTSKKVILHEQITHGLSFSPQIVNAAADVEESHTSDLGAFGHSRKRKLVPRSEFSENSDQHVLPGQTLKSNGKRGSQYTSILPAAKPLVKGKVKAIGSVKNPPDGASQIGIGYSAGAELMDSKKLKQLHWMYNCLKCDFCSDKSSKALVHYNKCYPDKEVPFEKSVVKYRHGFYGKYRCPFCPRRYTTIGGFVIHCGHMHSNYRKMFLQTQEGGLKCLHCPVEFSLPAEFNDHLVEGKCPEYSDTENETVRDESPIHKKAKPKASPKEYENPYDDMLAKRRSQTYIGRSPRSARLANRIINETLAKNIGSVDETAFPKINCPVCGADNIDNINLHLTTDHAELGVEVQRLSDDLLRCKKCKLTFAICDLFSHSNSCTGSKEFEFVSQRRAAAAKNKSLQLSPQKTEHKTYKIPEGVGCSPIDEMEYKNLNSATTLSAALKCSVCGKVARKLGVISDCLRSHGVHRCTLCFNSYLSKLDYSQHLKQCHGQGNPAGKLTCPICIKIFVNAGQAVSHMFRSHWIALLRETKAGDEAKQEERGLEQQELKLMRSHADNSAKTDETVNIIQSKKNKFNDNLPGDGDLGKIVLNDSSNEEQENPEPDPMNMSEILNDDAGKDGHEEEGNDNEKLNLVAAGDSNVGD